MRACIRRSDALLLPPALAGGLNERKIFALPALAGEPLAIRWLKPAIQNGSFEPPAKAGGEWKQIETAIPAADGVSDKPSPRPSPEGEGVNIKNRPPHSCRSKNTAAFRGLGWDRFVGRVSLPVGRQDGLGSPSYIQTGKETRPTARTTSAVRRSPVCLLLLPE